MGITIDGTDPFAEARGQSERADGVSGEAQRAIAEAAARAEAEGFAFKGLRVRPLADGAFEVTLVAEDGTERAYVA